MKKFVINAQYSIMVTVSAEDEHSIDPDAIIEAVIDEHGKYPDVDARQLGSYEILEELT